MKDIERIRKSTNEIKDWLTSVRRDFHMHPELGFEETRTRDKIIGYLEEMNIEYKVIAKTGVVGLIRGGKEGRTVGFRADIDALPIVDKKEVPYKSTVKGKMHACGHDAHTTILLGAAKILNDMKDELNGSVKLIFQPAEETTGGAKPMIEEGVLENPHVDGMFGLHVGNGIDVGKIAVKYGQMNAASDMIKIIIEGKSSHGAYPQSGVDAIAIAAQTIVAIQTIVSRNIDPNNPGVVTIGSIKGGTAGNIIADTVELEGIVRTLDPETREMVIDKLKRIVEKIPEGMGGKGTLIREKSYTSLINNDHMVDIVYRSGEELLGKDNIEIIKYPSFGVEDFSFFAEACDGAFFDLGSGNPNESIRPKAHNPYFDIDEDCLVYGVMMQVLNAINFLSE